MSGFASFGHEKNETVANVGSSRDASSACLLQQCPPNKSNMHAQARNPEAASSRQMVITRIRTALRYHFLGARELTSSYTICTHAVASQISDRNCLGSPLFGD